MSVRVGGPLQGSERPRRLHPIALGRHGATAERPIAHTSGQGQQERYAMTTLAQGAPGKVGPLSLASTAPEQGQGTLYMIFRVSGNGWLCQDEEAVGGDGASQSETWENTPTRGMLRETRSAHWLRFSALAEDRCQDRVPEAPSHVEVRQPRSCRSDAPGASTIAGCCTDGAQQVDALCKRLSMGHIVVATWSDDAEDYWSYAARTDMYAYCHECDQDPGGAGVGMRFRTSVAGIADA